MHYKLLFKLADIYKTTWMNPISKRWHLIDYVIVRQCDTQDVMIIRSSGVLNVGQIHRLDRLNLNIRIAPQHHNQPKSCRTSFNTARLQHPSYLQNFQATIDNKSPATKHLLVTATARKNGHITGKQFLIPLKKC